MDKNTDGSSAPTTGQPSADTYKNKVQEKSAMIGQKVGLQFTNIYYRFYRIPTLLSVIVGVLFSVVFAEVMYLFLPHNWVGFGAMVGFTVVVWGYIRPILNTVCLLMLIRRRIWEWGRYRFDTWEDIGKWMVRTHPEKLDALVVDESGWEPDLENGGILAK